MVREVEGDHRIGALYHQAGLQGFLGDIRSLVLARGVEGHGSMGPLGDNMDRAGPIAGLYVVSALVQTLILDGRQGRDNFLQLRRVRHCNALCVSKNIQADLHFLCVGYGLSDELDLSFCRDLAAGHRPHCQRQNDQPDAHSQSQLFHVILPLPHIYL